VGQWRRHDNRHCQRAHETNWQWRLSIADITQDCTFSAYPGTRRQIVALDAPLNLHFSDGRKVELLRLSGTHFDGADAPNASLPDGATRAFNVMLRGGAHG
jgi:environmental stress-induced protein Ves